MWKSFHLATGMVSTAALPFFAGVASPQYVPDGPCIIVANHSSFLDGPLLAAAYARMKLKPLHMVAYQEPFSHWLMGWVLRSGGCIPFRRGDPASQRAMLETALGWLRAGEAVGIFPEGHIGRRGVPGRARPGAALLALESGCPLVPAGIAGTAEALPPGAGLPRPGRRIRIRFGGSIGLFPKERQYASLPADDRAVLIRNLGVRIMSAIGTLIEKREGGPNREECRDA